MSEIEVTQADRRAALAVQQEPIYNMTPLPEHFARHRIAATAPLEARIEQLEREKAELVEAGNALRDRLLAFVGAVAEITDCGADVEAVKRWGRLT